jgi:hypothetical protein
MPTPSGLPRAREEDLIVQDLPEEVLVYDLARHKAHCLGRMTALVWRQCNGRREASDIARRVGLGSGSPADESAVLIALQQLSRAHLLTRPLATPHPGTGSRREWLKRAGTLAGLSLISITVPMPAFAASCTPRGQCESLPNALCTGRPCCENPATNCIKQGGGANCTCR